MRLNRADVVAALFVTDVLGYYGVPGHRGAAEFRTKICPACGEHASDWTTINLETGAWCHHGAPCRGDLLALVAGYGGLDHRTQFPKVLEVAATIAGVVPMSPPARLDADRRRAARRAAEVADAAALAERRREARGEATLAWDRAARRSPRGEAYLDRRGLCASELIPRGVLRFDPSGNPMVAIYDHATGAVVNTASRVIDATGDGKVLVRNDCPIVGTMIGRTRDLAPLGTDTAFIVEGVTDGLAAVHTWPGCVILAAHSAGQLARVAAEAAPWLREVGGRLFIVLDRGDAGTNAGVAALDAAEAAGLVLNADLHLVDLGRHQDLTAAVQSGWTWS